MYFFQRGVLSGKKQYAYVIMAEAIKEKRLSKCFEPRFLHIKKKDHLHREICKRNWNLDSRFSLHAINEKQENELLINVYKVLKRGGVEVRSIHDNLYGKGLGKMHIFMMDIFEGFLFEKN